MPTATTSSAVLPLDGGAEPSAGNSKVSRLRIAVLIDSPTYFGWGYQTQLRDALDARCRAQDHDLLLLHGGPLDGPNPANAADNAIFRLVRPGCFDGIIVVSTLLAAFCGPERVARLVDTYRPTSLCSFGIALPGVPSLVLDNRTGMEAVVEHMIREHGCRRLAFLGGAPKNPEAETRFAAYKDVLARHAIPVDPSLVACGYFQPGLGQVAMEEILARNLGFDGVLAANDMMALGAIAVLRKQGRRVPQDVPVTGFDDLPLARVGNPPLTTVAQPFELLANLAVKLIEDQVAGLAVPECTQVPAQFVRRKSCGCGLPPHPEDADARVASRVTLAQHLRERIEPLRGKLAGELRAGSDDGSLAATRLLDGLLAEATGGEDAFPAAVNQLLESMGDDGERYQLLAAAIIRLRENLRDRADLGIERAFFEGMSLVALSSTSTQMQQQLTREDSFIRLLTVSEQASVAFDLSSLKEALEKGLPAAGIRTAFLSCTPEADTTDFVPVVSLVDGASFRIPETKFPASRLLPPSAFQLGRRHTFLVFPMVLEAEILGVIAFDNADGINAYGSFRNEVTAVLKSIRLHQQLMKETMLHERSVQERLATTKRMEALSVLAGGVAHDLNNALGPLVALPDVILDELLKPRADENTLRDLRADIASIKTASLRAAQTIKDLLTLGRQGRTEMENIDLNRVVESCLADNSLRFTSKRNRHINMVVDYVAGPLPVRGSESQLARAVGNLVRNAVEAIDGNGEVAVKTSREHVATPAGHYETIPAGSYAVLTVTDDGYGIEALELARVFEPFFTKKHTGESSGSGLGLAIVHGVVKEHAGFIDVVSVVDSGTTFSLYLPLAKESQGRAEPIPTTPGCQAKILIVDDEAIQLRTCRRVLARMGYDVETTRSGLGAYELFSRAAQTGRSPYDLIIMDMALDETLDGLQIFELIQRLFPAQKAIVASGHAPSERAELAVQKGLIWLAKPYSVEALTRAVACVLEGSNGR